MQTRRSDVPRTDSDDDPTGDEHANTVGEASNNCTSNAKTTRPDDHRPANGERAGERANEQRTSVGDSYLRPHLSFIQGITGVKRKVGMYAQAEIRPRVLPEKKLVSNDGSDPGAQQPKSHRKECQSRRSRCPMLGDLENKTVL